MTVKERKEVEHLKKTLLRVIYWEVTGKFSKIKSLKEAKENRKSTLRILILGLTEEQYTELEKYIDAIKMEELR